MSAKFTPGPLEVVQVESWPFDIQVVNQQGCVVFLEGRYSYSSKQKSLEDVMTGYGFPKEDRDVVVSANEEQLANAHLRAAAPDFFDGAQDFVAYEDAMEAGDDVRAMALYDSASKKLRAAIAKAMGESK